MAVIISKKIVVPTFEKKLSDYAEGDIVKIPENGTPAEFYVAKHDYESVLNGTGRTLVVRNPYFDQIAFDSRNNNNFDTSQICVNVLNGTYLSKFSEKVKNLIGTTKFYCTDGGSQGIANIVVMQHSIFLLSAKEIGSGWPGTPQDGTILPNYDILSGYNIGQYLYCRTASASYDGLVYTTSPGSANRTTTDFANNPRPYRPVFTLPSDALFNPDTNIIKG